MRKAYKKSSSNLPHNAVQSTTLRQMNIMRSIKLAKKDLTLKHKKD